MNKKKKIKYQKILFNKTINNKKIQKFKNKNENINLIKCLWTR